MRSKLPDPDRAVRSAVAVSVAALITAAALFGALAPKAAALPLPLPATTVESLVTEGVTVEGPLINNIALR
ncbi:hypothetical protein [Streptomyces sp. AC602_WCS936]|uniref:hypothetical protein n=1 Tax=Streptomyces sp. AC602_WCS936 TaxID=2823685 RepID=UPI001C26C154|nr:hypothetical protein [Streptomyces sp. AC602_WCS936]